MQFEIATDAILYAAKQAAENGIPIFFDAGPANPTFPYEKLPKITLFSPNETETEIYTGITDVHTTQVWSHGSSIYISNAPTNTIATLYNISGHKLLTTPIHHTPYTLDLSYLPKGVYMLQLNTQVYKFVIQ